MPIATTNTNNTPNEPKKIGYVAPPPPVQENTQGSIRIIVGVVGIAIVVGAIYFVHKKFFR
jgi:hypothetical protein